VNRSEDLVAIGFVNAAILDEQVLGILGEAWGHEDTEGRGKVGLKGDGHPDESQVGRLVNEGGVG